MGWEEIWPMLIDYKVSRIDRFLTAYQIALQNPCASASIRAQTPDG